jgi:hypothetical protein
MPDDPRLHNQGPRGNNPAQRDQDRREAGVPVDRAWKDDPTVKPLTEVPPPTAPVGNAPQGE